MKRVEKFIGTLLILLCVASSALCADPFAVNPGGFGPDIDGVKLGMKLSLSELTEWLIKLKKLPFTIEINNGRFNYANNYSNAGDRNNSKGGISIKFHGSGSSLNGYEIIRSSIGLPKNLMLGDIFKEVEKHGVSNISIFFGTNSKYPEDIITFNKDMRVASIKLRKTDLTSESVPDAKFVNDIMAKYKIPRMGNRGNVWQYKNRSQGWQISYFVFGGGMVLVESINTK